MDWFRVWHEVRGDRKLDALTGEQFRVWLFLLCYASERIPDSERGQIPAMDEELLAIECSKGDTELLRATVSILTKLHVIEQIEDGSLRFCNWERRQPSSDNSNMRTQKYRERMLANGADGATEYVKHRQAVYERDGYACVYCGSTKRLCLDHSVPVVQGGDSDIANLVTACKACNAGKAGRTPEQANLSFHNPDAAKRYAANRSRLGLSAVTVTVTPPDTETDTETDTEDTPPTPSKGRDEYSPEFEQFWKLFPYRTGHSKKLAFKCWQARLKEGVSPADLHAAAANYAKEREGKDSTFTKMASTFLGPNEHWKAYLVQEERPIQQYPDPTEEYREEWERAGGNR
jgi:hypothetical protein